MVRTRRLSATLLATLLVACGGGGEPSGPAEPTEPLPARLLFPVDAETKEPAAALLTRPERLANHDFREGLGPWRAVGATVRRFEGGVELIPTGEGEFGIELTDLDWDAATLQVVGLTARFQESGWVLMHYARPGDPEGPGFPPGQAVFERAQATAKARSYGFVTTASEGWTGRIARIGFEFEPGLGAVRLENVHAVEQALLPGASPRVERGQVVDAGMIELGRADSDLMACRNQSRRAVPARAERYGVCLFQAGAGERLAFSYALPPIGRHLTGPVTFRLFATPAEGREPARDAEPLFEATLVPGRGDDRWHTASIPLPDTGGEEFELWLHTSGGRPRGGVNGLWGPLLVGAPDAEPDQPSVLVITADTLRADHVGFLRAQRGLAPLPGLSTPNLDALFARGVTFTDALSTCNSTSPSHVSIFTSLHVKDHGVITNELVLPDAHTTLGEVMSDSGRFAVAAVTARHLNSEWSGLGQGMHVYLESPPISDLPERGPVATPSDLPSPSPQTVLFATAAYQTPALLSVIDELEGAPFYAWLHAFDVHTPYQPRADILAELELPRDEDDRALLTELSDRYYEVSGTERPADDGEALTEFLYKTPALYFLGDVRTAEYARALYAAGVTQLDHDLGLLFDELERRGRLDDTLIVFTADHGEALGERDVWFGHEGLYDNTLHVPLTLAGPGVPRGVVSHAPVSTLDLVPTVCELLDLEPPPDTTGLSLVDRFADGERPDRRRWYEYASGLAVGYSDLDEHVFLTAVAHPLGTFGEVVERGRIERYLRREDGSLTERNLADELGDDLPALREELRTWLLQRTVDLGPAGQAKVTGTDQAVLEALGYIRR